MHLDCTDWSIPIRKRRLRKRLAWALFMQDKWSALVHRWLSHINAADWAVQPPTVEDSIPPLSTPGEGGDNSQMEQGRSIFMQMITLTSIMAQVCETFYSQTARAEYARAGKFASQLVLRRAKSVQIKLRDWFARLPPSCKMDHHQGTTTPGQPSPIGHFHLAYFALSLIHISEPTRPY